MTSQSPRIYTYKITFEEVPYYYYGVKKEKYYNQEYWGSPKTNKWCWELYTPKKQILELFEYSDEGWLEAQSLEKRLIKPFYNNDIWCLNANCGGIFSLESIRKFATGRTHQCGEKNSQYGKMWINNEKISCKILKNEVIPLGFLKGKCKMRMQKYCVDCEMPIGFSSYRCTKCCYIKNGIKSRKFDISQEDLINLINKYPMTKVGEILGVSCTAVIKRCNMLGIDYKSIRSKKS